MNNFTKNTLLATFLFFLVQAETRADIFNNSFILLCYIDTMFGEKVFRFSSFVRFTFFDFQRFFVYLMLYIFALFKKVITR